MDFHFDTLWSQAGGEFVGVVIFVILVILQMIKAVLDARNANTLKKNGEQSIPTTNEAGERVIVPVRSKKERKKQNSDAFTSQEEKLNKKEKRQRHQALSRELAPQGEGQRFEAAPGTFDASNIVTPSVEPTVNPVLESITGIYEADPNSTEQPDQPLTLDIQKLITRPEGIRQAIILAEILKRPS